MRLDEMDFNESHGELWMIMDYSGRVYKQTSYRNGTVMSSHLKHAALFHSQEDAKHHIDTLLDRLPSEFKVVQVKDVMKIVYRVQVVMEGVPFLSLSKLWMEPYELQGEFNERDGIFESKEAARRFLQHWKSELVKFYQEQMINTSRMQIP